MADDNLKHQNNTAISVAEEKPDLQLNELQKIRGLKITGRYIHRLINRGHAAMEVMESYLKRNNQNFSDSQTYNDIRSSLKEMLELSLDENKRFKLESTKNYIKDTKIINAVQKLSESISEVQSEADIGGILVSARLAKLSKKHVE